MELPKADGMIIFTHRKLGRYDIDMIIYMSRLSGYIPYMYTDLTITPEYPVYF